MKNQESVEKIKKAALPYLMESDANTINDENDEEELISEPEDEMAELSLELKEPNKERKGAFYNGLDLEEMFKIIC